MNWLLDWNNNKWWFATQELAQDFINFWKFPVTQYNLRTREEYKGFVIEPSDLWAIKFTECPYQYHESEKVYYAKTVESCKEEIDEILNSEL